MIDIPLKNLLFIDTETGGLDPYRHSLLEVAMTAYVDGKPTLSLSKYVSNDSYIVTPEALAINKIDLKVAKEQGLKPQSLVNTIDAFIVGSFDSKPIIVGHNVAFDLYFLREAFRKNDHDLDSIISHRVIDTMSLLWGLHLIGLVPLEACSSNGAFKYFNIKNENEHQALSDVKATIELFECIVNLMKERLL